VHTAEASAALAARAAKVSSTLSNTVVWMLPRAPPPPIAIVTAAIEILSDDLMIA